MDKKRLIIAFVFIIVCVLIGYAMYRVFFVKTKPTQLRTPPQTEKTGQQLPTIGPGEIPTVSETKPATLPLVETKPIVTPVTTLGEKQGVITATPGVKAVTQAIDVMVKGVIAAGGSSVKFYNEQDGRFYRLLPDGTTVPLSDQVFFNVQKVTWSPKNNETILEYPDGANIYYNFDAKRQVTLPKHWEEFSFSSLGDKIAAKSIGLNPENRWLIAASPDGSSIKLIEPIGENANKVTVDWSPNKQVVALSRTGEPLGERQEVLLVGLNGENFKSLVVEGRGLQTKWSPQGKKLLHSVYNSRNDYKPELWIVDAETDTVGQNRTLLNINTWASKCAMSDERFIYCGVPTDLQTGAGFAPEIANTTPDQLYKIDTATGLKTAIPLEDTYTIDTITISEDGKTLFFTDKNKSGVFKVNI